MFEQLFPRLALQAAEPVIMGIVNVTPDSFYSGSRRIDPQSAVEMAVQMEDDGASIIDIGGESTRPGADDISVEEELLRVIPVIEAIRQNVSIPISIDTTKPDVMRAACCAGASLINDVRALREPGALAVAAEMKAQVCLMHMLGKPRTMQENPLYDDVVIQVGDFLQQRIEACLEAGIQRDNLMIDPGFGFGKTVNHNLKLVNKLEYFTQFGVPILIGVSRKSTIGQVLNVPAAERLTGSLALAVMAMHNGATVIRTHDVKETKQAVTMFRAVKVAE